MTTDSFIAHLYKIKKRHVFPMGTSIKQFSRYIQHEAPLSQIQIVGLFFFLFFFYANENNYLNLTYKLLLF